MDGRWMDIWKIDGQMDGWKMDRSKMMDGSNMDE